MSMKKKMLAVIKGDENLGTPFCQYSNLAAGDEEIWEAVGEENMGIVGFAQVTKSHYPNCKISSEEMVKDGFAGVRTVIETPSGSLVQEKLREPAFGSFVIKKQFIENADDIALLKEFLNDRVIEKDSSEFAGKTKGFGEHGLVHINIERTPYQQLLLEWISATDLAYMMFDSRGIVEECMDIMWKGQVKAVELVREVCMEMPVPYINSFENVTAPLTGLSNFENYCLNYYNEIADILQDTKVPYSTHFDGDLKPLWEDIKKMKSGIIEGFSPKPDNDTGLDEALTMWEDKKILMNFPSSVHLANGDAIYETTIDILEQAGKRNRMWIQVSENVPKGLWEKSFPQIIKAIRDYG